MQCIQYSLYLNKFFYKPFQCFENGNKFLKNESTGVKNEMRRKYDKRIHYENDK